MGDFYDAYYRQSIHFQPASAANYSDLSPPPSPSYPSAVYMPKRVGSAGVKQKMESSGLQVRVRKPTKATAVVEPIVEVLSPGFTPATRGQLESVITK